MSPGVAPPPATAHLSRILSAAITIAFCTALAKVAGAAKVIFTARYFGAGDAVDAFLIAFLLPAFIADVIAGCFTPTVIPWIIQLRAQEDDASAMRLARTALTAIVTLLGSVAVLLALCGHWVLAALGSSFSPEKLRLTTGLFFILLIWL